MQKILLVAGARPNFMKIAPLMAEAKRNAVFRKKFQIKLVHTGQHYDEKMSKVFFSDLGIRSPDINLGVGGGSHAEQTAKIMFAFDAVLEKEKPDLVVVVGDVNSTIACALTAKKRGIQVAHVEAGLRSFDNEMPEEINRVLTDRISDFLFCTERSAIKNLKKEGITENVYLTGNTMIDTLLLHTKIAHKSTILADLKLERRKYAVLTIHRPSNVDRRDNLEKIIKIMGKIVKVRGLKIIFPVHPRTDKNLADFGIKTGELTLIQPLGYLDFLQLISHSTLALTDSGGIQEETTVLGIPCLTLRENTERPVTVTDGTNQIVGTDEKKILSTVSKILKRKGEKKVRIPKLWDGKAAKRIISVIAKKL